MVSIPIGLSSKELAQLRSDGLRPQPTDGWSSDLSLVATVTTDEGVAAEATSSSEAQRLRSEVDFLRHEVQQLRAERSEAPPTYASASTRASGGATEDGAA